MTTYNTQQIFGTAQTVINTSSDVSAGNFTGAPAAAFANNDTVVPNATHALAVLFVNDWTAAPTAGQVVELWGILLDIDGTSDETDAPSGTSSGGARYFGAFAAAAADAAQRRPIVISLEGVKSGITVNFYLKNATSVGMTNSGTNCTLKVTPFSYGLTV